MVKYGQKSTFDRKVVETPFFYQNDQNKILKIFPSVWSHFALECFLKGEGGVPWVQIMENELEYLADRGGHGGHLGEKFVKKYCS